MVFTCEYCRCGYKNQRGVNIHQARCPNRRINVNVSNNRGPSAVPHTHTNTHTTPPPTVDPSNAELAKEAAERFKYIMNSLFENNPQMLAIFGKNDFEIGDIVPGTEGRVGRDPTLDINHNSFTDTHNFTNNFNLYVKYDIIDMNRYIKRLRIRRIPMSLIYQILNW